MHQLEIRHTTASDQGWIQALLAAHWGSCLVISRGRAYHADKLPGLIATDGDERLGLLTYSINGAECEIVTFNSVKENRGVGTTLLKAAETVVRSAGCSRLFLITTNDNTNALHFYQRQGFVLVALHRNAIERSRRLKPEIPAVGNYDIPIRDEIELELQLIAT